MPMTSAAAEVVTMSIYTVLEGEHSETLALFKTLEAAPETVAGRSALFTKLGNELISHTVAEQKMVYDKVKTKNAAQTIIEHAEREHADMEHRLNELSSMDIKSDAWLLKLVELRDHVQRHVREEETTLFDKMHAMFSDDEARAMANDFLRMKDAELKQLKKT